MIPRTPAAPGFFMPGGSVACAGAEGPKATGGGGGGGAAAGYGTWGVCGVWFVSLIILTLPSGTSNAWRRFRGGRRRGLHGLDGAAEDPLEHELRISGRAGAARGERAVDAVVEALRKRRRVAGDGAVLDAPDRGDARVRERALAGGRQVGRRPARGGHGIHVEEREDEDRRGIGRRDRETPVGQHRPDASEDAAPDVFGRRRGSGRAGHRVQAREERRRGLGLREGAGRQEREDLGRGLAARGVVGLLRETREKRLGGGRTREERAGLGLPGDERREDAAVGAAGRVSVGRGAGPCGERGGV